MMPRGDQPDAPTTEQQVELLLEQLRHAQRMTALGELASTTTHEFNNVLTTILNYAKMGLRHRDDATRDKAFDKIMAAAKRAERITNGVLGLARNRGREMEATDLAKIVGETLVLMERELQKYRVQVVEKLDPAPPVMASGNQIQQVLLNLITNARQAMRNGGTLTLGLHHDRVDNVVQLSVRDTGSGIPHDELPRIFDRFYSTKSGPDASGKGGTGVGLALCRDIIDSHRGRIRVESSVGKGTLFTLLLPPAEATSAADLQLPQLGIPSNTAEDSR